MGRNPTTFPCIPYPKGGTNLIQYFFACFSAIKRDLLATQSHSQRNFLQLFSNRGRQRISSMAVFYKLHRIVFTRTASVSTFVHHPFVTYPHSNLKPLSGKFSLPAMGNNVPAYNTLKYLSYQPFLSWYSISPIASPVKKYHAAVLWTPRQVLYTAGSS